jgi:hypothetical protein
MEGLQESRGKIVTTLTKSTIDYVALLGGGGVVALPFMLNGQDEYVCWQNGGYFSMSTYGRGGGCQVP